MSGVSGTLFAIPFNRPTQTPQDAGNIQAALAQVQVVRRRPVYPPVSPDARGAGGCAKALLTTSCTHALEMAALLLDIRAGDEVIVPSFTFVSSVNAFVLRGARPVFADVRPDTLCIDERHLESLITDRTRAVVVVHYAGVGVRDGRNRSPLRRVPGARSLKTMRTASSAGTKGANSAPLARSRRSVFTRPRM